MGKGNDLPKRYPPNMNHITWGALSHALDFLLFRTLGVCQEQWRKNVRHYPAGSGCKLVRLGIGKIEMLCYVEMSNFAGL